MTITEAYKQHIKGLLCVRKLFLIFVGAFWGVPLIEFLFIANVASFCCSDPTESNGKSDLKYLFLPPACSEVGENSRGSVQEPV